jgi:hypothetical protein
LARNNGEWFTMDLSTLERHIVADSYHPAILNQYPYDNFEFAKLAEQTTFAGFPPWASVSALRMPAFFSRYHLEVLLRKGGGTPGNGPVRRIIPRRGLTHVPSEVVKPTAFSNGKGFTVTAEDFGITEGSSASITMCLYHPGSEGDFGVTTKSGRIVIEDRVERIMTSISRYRQNLAIGFPPVAYDEFPLTIQPKKSRVSDGKLHVRSGCGQGPDDDARAANSSGLSSIRRPNVLRRFLGGL